MIRTVLTAGTAVLLVASAPATSQTAAEFYAGKTVTLGIASGVGGSLDVYARLLARHLGRHIPGGPAVVPKNVPGAGGLQLANQVYRTQPQDGTTIGAVQQAVPFEPLFGGKNSRAEFDALKFHWLGSPVRFSAVAIAWNASTPVRKAEDLRNHEMIVGSAGLASSSTNDAYVLRNVLGFRYRVILGYPSGADIDLAMQRGETQGRANIAWEGIKNRNPAWLRDDKVTILYQLGLEKHPDIPANVPLVLDFAATPEDRQVLELKFASYGLGYPYMTAPGAPADRVAALRRAAAAALNDPALRAEAAKMRLEIDPVSGEAIAQILQKAYGAPPRVLERLAEVSRLPAKIDRAEPVKLRATLSAVENQGRRIGFEDRGRASTAAVTPGTRLTIRGANAEAAQLAVGMACEIAYFGDRGQALSVACD